MILAPRTCGACDEAVANPELPKGRLNWFLPIVRNLRERGGGGCIDADLTMKAVTRHPKILSGRLLLQQRRLRQPASAAEARHGRAATLIVPGIFCSVLSYMWI